MPINKPFKLLAIASSIALFNGCASVAPSSSVYIDDIDWTSPTMIEGRANMLYPGLNYLSFQHFDQMFSTRTVHAGNTTWRLPYNTRTLNDVPYRLHDETLSFDGVLESTRTNGLLVIQDGQIVHEQYRNGMSPSSRHTVYSMSKSIIATLVGIALDEGHIRSLDDQVTDYLPRMAGSGFDGVTIEDVLRMRSGVDWEERYEFGSQTQLTEVHDNAVVGYKYRWCDYAEGSKKLHEPDEVFNYSTLDTSILGCILEAATGKQVASYMTDKIWQPAGMEFNGFWIMDGAKPVGDEFYGAGFNASLRDLGRFGLMMLNQGVANKGKQVVPQAWVDQSTIAEGKYATPWPNDSWGYAYQWWTLSDREAYMALGLYNQFIYIDPVSNTVIVKLSYPEAPLGDEEGNIQFFDQIIEQLASTR